MLVCAAPPRRDPGLKVAVTHRAVLCADPRCQGFLSQWSPFRTLGFLTATSLTDILSRWVWVELRAAVNLFKKIFR